MFEPVPIVPSSNLHEVSYDLDAMMLLVTFKSGKSYRYINVPGDVVARLQQALSSGQYFTQYIRDAFPAEKVG